MSDIKWMPVFIIGIIALVIGGFIGGIAFPKEIEKDCPGLNQTDCPTVNETDCPECEAYPECKTDEEIEEEAMITGGYLMDGLFLETTFNETLSDREIYLFDGEVEFGGKDYDAEEIFTIANIELRANEDFEENVYLTIPEKGFVYEFSLESLNTSLIGDNDHKEETLVFNLLGKEVEISEWDIDKVKFSMGSSHYLKEGESIVVNNKNITLYIVFDDKVYVTVGDEDRSIGKGETARVGDLEIFVKEIDYQSYQDGYKQAILIIGTDVESTISTGDEYEEDSIWEWVITPNSIGLTLIEEFTELDEDFNALAPEEKICLPNDYVCVRYNGLIGEDTEKYTFKSDGEFIKIKGKFLKDTTEYDEIYIYSNGSIYEDNEYDSESYIGEEVIVIKRYGENPDSVLQTSGGVITIEDFEVNFDLNDVWTNALNISNKDENYRTNYGILIENPKDNLEDNEVRLEIPKEKLEGIITVKKGGFEEEPVCDVDNLELCLNETTCTDAKGYWYGDVCNVEEASSE